MLFRFVRSLVKGILYLLFRIKIHGKENMPKEGAVIVAMNHQSLWDGPLAAACLPRQLAIMGKKELFKIPLLGSILRWAGVIPVARGKNDIGAIKAALSALKAGKAFAIFPEGRRVRQGEDHTAKSGVAMLAARTGAPILPVAISGKYRFLSKINVYIQKPIHVKSENGEKLTGDELQEVSDYLIQMLLHTAGYGEKPIKKETYTWTLE
ncbi:MAG: 1-acyl-sn-glycerol-3-phosphate acyltransferase [Clostridia bacterium]|nr:1-acyl-sn-glycerol-3-phosphate acyltransferase [Clostridia bacterium]